MSSVCVCVCVYVNVYVPPRALITMVYTDPVWLVKQVVGIFPFSFFILHLLSVKYMGMALIAQYVTKKTNLMLY